MKNSKPFLNMTVKLIIVILVIIYIVSNIGEITYSLRIRGNPDVVVTINNNGIISQKGNLFGNDLWYPGKRVSGVLRIYNQHSPVKISNFGANVELKETSEAYGWEMIYNSFIDNMKLTLIRGRLPIFEKTIVQDASLEELLYKSNDSNKKGLMLKAEDQFNVGRNNFIDLQYILYMDEKSGNELQRLTADVSFLINVHTMPADNEGGGDDEIGGIPETENPEDDIETIELPEDLIPLGRPHWANDYILALLRHGIITGYPDGTIKPDQPITRAETAALIAKALKIEPQNKISSDYKDLLPEWAKGHIIAVSEKGIFVGYPDKQFKADRNITREEMVTVMVKAFKKNNNNSEINYTDLDEIGYWALDYVKAGTAHEIIKGYPDGSFRPKREITRAETFVIICKLLELHE